MPGILGFVTENPDQQAAERELARMLRGMRPGPAFSSGTYAVPEMGCYLGWVAHRGSYADCNPVVHDTGDVTLIFAGEHFSRRGGRECAPRSLVSSYVEQGARFIAGLNGWFSGVLVDRRERRVLLFNDRFGVHRVYYHEGRDSFTFASEAKAILAVRPATRRLSAEGVGHFLSYGAVFANRTLFQDISLVPGGSAWDITDPVSVRRDAYFHPRTWEEQPPLDPNAFYASLRDTLRDVVPSYFRSQTSLALSLTGGLDTRIVVAGMPPDAGKPPSYTYAGVYRECFDVQVARCVASSCGLTHQTIALGPDFFREFGTHAEQTVWLTDGCLDICGSHEIYYSRRARETALIRLTGNYGSEVLRSVSTFKFNAPAPGLFEPEIAVSVAAAVDTFAPLRAAHPVTFAAFSEIPWNLFGRLGAAQAELVVRSPYMDNSLVALMYRAPAATRETNETSVRLIADLNPTLAAIMTDMGYGHGQSGPIAKARQLHRYLLFKAEWYYNVGMPDWAAALNKVVPLRAFEPIFLGSHKIDHYRLWFHGALKDYLLGVLTDRAAASRPYVNRKGHEALVAAYRSDSRNCLNDVNKLVTLELVQRLLVERAYPA